MKKIYENKIKNIILYYVNYNTVDLERIEKKIEQLWKKEYFLVSQQKISKYADILVFEKITSKDFK